MKIFSPQLDISPAQEGEYEFWCGKNAHSEVPPLMVFLKALHQGKSIRVILHPEESKEFQWLGDGLVIAPGEIREESVGELVIYTSGTTGKPKPITKTNFGEYARNKRGRGAASDTWLLTYNHYRWAGISLLTHVIHHGCSVVVPNSLNIIDIYNSAKLATHMSFTPTLFRKMLLHIPSNCWAELSIKQITFGGEMATQGILDFAKQIFPMATITHTYASTEFGDICSASDGREGFEERKLSYHSFDSEGELFIGGKPTGDLWRREGGRLFFSGRREGLVNIGGNKIALHTVEEAALSIRGVYHAVAGSVASPFMGQVVTLGYVGDIEPRLLQKELRSRLPKFACPASLNRLLDVEIASTGKARR